MLNLVDENSGVAISANVFVDMTVYGAGRPIVLLHGAEGALADVPFAQQLAVGNEVYLPSHPGFDLSPRPDWLDSVDDLAYSYLNWMEQIDARNVILIGLQFGGWVAAEIAVRSCERLSHLVLVDAVGIRVGDYEVRDIADVFSMSRTELNSRIFWSDDHSSEDLTQASVESVDRVARNEEALAVFGWEPYLHNPRLRRWLHRINVPALLVWGEHDGIVSPDYGASFAAAIPGARFEAVAQAGHRPQVEKPDDVARLIKAFVSSTTGNR